MTTKHLNKRQEIITGMLDDLIAGHDVIECTRNPMNREDAEFKLNSLLSDPVIVRTINAMAVAWSK